MMVAGRYLLGVLVLLLAGGHTLFFPVVRHDAMAAQGKKGVGLFAGDCDVLEQLAVTWYYTGPVCPGYDRVEYLSHPEAFDRVVMPGSSVLLWNEPDLNGWSVPYMVGLFVPYAEACPDCVWVGPCPAYDLGLVRAFWEEFERQAGWAMPRDQIRVCVHCYEASTRCKARVNEAADLARFMGLGGRSVWLTEFGRPLGLDLTIREQVEETAMFVDWLEANSMVGAYAYWPAVLRAGVEVPNGKYSSWQPLAVEWYDWDLETVIGYQLTEVGQVYAGSALGDVLP